MDSAFSIALQASQGRRHVCLGLRLRPLTVGHLFVLAENGNAFPDHPEAAKDYDLITAVLVCAQRHRPARSFVYSWVAPLFCAFWGAIWAFVRRGREVVGAEDFAGFAAYLEEQLIRPEPESPPGGPQEVRAPLAWRLYAMLMADFHLSPKEAMDFPVAQALCLWATEADRRGVSNLASERVINFRRWAEQQEIARRGAEGAEVLAARATGGEG